jgi:phage-related holin
MKEKVNVESMFKYIGAALLSIIAPVQAVMLTVGFLIFTDTVTGIMAAKKRGEKLSSSGFRRVVAKMLTYQLAVLSGFFVETYIGVGFPVTKAVAGAIAISELSSMVENIQVVTGTKLDLTSMPTLKKLLENLLKKK